MNGTLYLVPNTLDFGVATELPPLSDDLPMSPSIENRAWVR